MTWPIVVGDTVRLVAGCDKIRQTCHAKFDNNLNFRGEPHIHANTRCSHIPCDGQSTSPSAGDE